MRLSIKQKKNILQKNMAKVKIVFVDTNVFLRSVLDDNVEQAKKAGLLFEMAVLNKVELKTTVVVFFEIAWVLSSHYKIIKEDLVVMLLDLLNLKTSFVGKRVYKMSVKNMQKFNYDLEDAFNFYSAKEMEVNEFVTFDAKLEKAWKKVI